MPVLFTEYNFSQLVEDKSPSVSQGKQKIGNGKYTSLQKTYNILSSGGILKKYNYKFRIDTIKVVWLMYHMQEKLQLKADRLHNVTIAGQKFKNLPVYERGVKGLQSLLK